MTYKFKTFTQPRWLSNPAKRGVPKQPEIVEPILFLMPLIELQCVRWIYRDFLQLIITRGRN
ncbi:MAG: hypothetical protein D8M61_16480 [Ignavibacteriae bacterium]|nr:hypothetical protein [Ignavibacteriota bacterium]